MALPVSIDDFKATITRRGGLARGNRFALWITHPSTTMDSLLNTSKEKISGLAKLVGRPNYMEHNARDMYMLCESVQIPGKRIVTMEQPISHFTAKKPYTMLTEEIALTFLLTNDYHVRKYFDEWMHMTVDSRDFQTYYKTHYCKDIIIQQLTPKGVENNMEDYVAYSIRLQDAFPLAISAIDLTNTAESASLSMTVTMAYTTWYDLTESGANKRIIEIAQEIRRETDIARAT